MNNRRILTLNLLLIFTFALLPTLIMKQTGTASAEPIQIDDGPKIYWTDEDRIWSANLDGSQITPLSGYLNSPESIALSAYQKAMYVVLDEFTIVKMDYNAGNQQIVFDGHSYLSFPSSLAINDKHHRLYWMDNYAAAIGQVNMDGSEFLYQLPPGPGEANGLAIDETEGSVYWLNRGRLHRSKLNGSDTKFFPDLAGITDMALDLGAQKIYLVQTFYRFYGYSILRASMDGSNIESLVYFENGGSEGIALDLDQGKIYWSERGRTPRIMRANLDGTETEAIIDRGVFGPYGLALDTNAGKIYWADWVAQKIQRANLDGSGMEDLLSTVPARPRYLTLDTAAGKMLWTGDRGASVWQANLDGSNVQILVPGESESSTGGIGLYRAGGYLYWIDGVNQAVTRAKMDGTKTEKIIFQRLADPLGLALDEVAGKMYWANRDQDEILRANLDGSAVEVLVNQGIDTPTSLALDLLHGKMVWTEPLLREINRANLDGSAMETLLSVKDGLAAPNLIALDVSGGKMYWTDYGHRSLYRADLDGKNIEDLVTEQILLPSGLALKIPPLAIHHVYMPIAR